MVLASMMEPELPSGWVCRAKGCHGDGDVTLEAEVGADPREQYSVALGARSVCTDEDPVNLSG